MKISEYQVLASRTINSSIKSLSEDQMILLNFCLGLAGESGEVLELFKKGIFHKHGVDSDKVAKELGDVIWYVAGICSVMGIDMETVMEDNIAKLKERYPDGFSYHDSINRNE